MNQFLDKNGIKSDDLLIRVSQTDDLPGDKHSVSRTKGTVGAVYNQEDMPFQNPVY